MTTYGPGRLSLVERLVSADAVVLISAARLVDSKLDELSEQPREIGVFELSIAEALDGDVTETVRVRVVRNVDGAWPIEEKGDTLALLQRDPPDRDWLLVQGSAYRVSRGAFVFRDAINPRDRSTTRERVTVDAIRRLVEDRRARAKKDEAELLEREGRRMRTEPRLPSEMPESFELTAWLDVEHGQGGREGKLGGTSTDIVPTRRRKRDRKTAR